jgi:hypothetical protein
MIMLYHEMHAIEDTKEEVYHAILDAKFLVQYWKLCNFYLWDTNCELHPNSYFHSFYGTGCMQWAIELFVFSMLLYCT